jgi:hypothetical protein
VNWFSERLMRRIDQGAENDEPQTEREQQNRDVR